MLVSGSGIAALAVLLGSVVAAGAADAPPALDLTATCAAAAQVALDRDRKMCLEDERAARDQLTRSWSRYRAADKAHCIATVTSGGPASYVELEACLDVMKGAKDTKDAGAGIAEEPPAPADPPRSR